MQRKSNSSVPVIFFFLITSFLFFGCDKSISSDTYIITKVDGENTLVLDDELRVELLGIQGSPKVRESLLKLIGEEVQVVLDNRNPYPHNVNQPFPAYIRLIRTNESLNGKLLLEKTAGFDRTNLHDSLTSFTSYAGAPAPPAPSEQAPDNVDKPDIPSSNGKVEFETYEPGGTKYSASEIFEKNINSVFAVCVLVSKDEYAVIGSGFFISGNIGMTNYHVIKDNSKFFIKTKDGSFEEVTEIINYSKDLDYAFLKIDVKKPHPPVQVANARPPIGEDVVLIGNPRGLEFSLSKGVVSAYRKIVLRDKEDYIQVDAAASPGNSGSPLFNIYGQVVGILTSGLQDCQNCNFCLWIGLVNK